MRECGNFVKRTGGKAANLRRSGFSGRANLCNKMWLDSLICGIICHGLIYKTCGVCTMSRGKEEITVSPYGKTEAGIDNRMIICKSSLGNCRKVSISG